MNQPKTVSELYPSQWLKAVDLPKAVTVKIETVGFEEVFNPRTNSKEPRLVIKFAKAQKRLIPNKTQCEALWKIIGTEVFTDWKGATVVVAPGKSHNGKDTIVISKPANVQPPKPATAEQPQGPNGTETKKDLFLARMAETTGFTVDEVKNSIVALGFKEYTPEKEAEIERLLTEEPEDEW